MRTRTWGSQLSLSHPLFNLLPKSGVLISPRPSPWHGGTEYGGPHECEEPPVTSLPLTTHSQSHDPTFRCRECAPLRGEPSSHLSSLPCLLLCRLPHITSLHQPLNYSVFPGSFLQYLIPSITIHKSLNHKSPCS